ncbi:hypothetical protein UT300005_04050 [Clostridium sp. CTA-5]
MGVFEVLITISIFITVYLIIEISKTKKKLVRLIQENAVIWQFIKEQKNK